MRTLAQTFSLIRVVNLPERKDRLREMSVQLSELGSPFSPGHVEAFPAIRPAEAADFPSTGARGCFLSHPEILRDALAREVESVLVLEDDLEVPPGGTARLNGLMEHLPEHWSILYPGHIHPVPPTPQPQWLRFNGPLGTSHCYAVHGTALPELIGYLEGCLTRPAGDPVGGPMHYDGALTMFRASHPELPTYIAAPSLARQRSSRSDVSVRRLEQFPGLREAASLARRVRRHFLRD